MQIDKAKLLDWLDKRFIESKRNEDSEWATYSDVITEIESGTFDLIPTDVDIEALKMRVSCLAHGSLMINENDFDSLVSKYTETLEKVKWIEIGRNNERILKEEVFGNTRNWKRSSTK